MADKDIQERRLFEIDYYFINIFNYYFYKGRKVITSVKEIDTKNVVNIPENKTRERDVFKEAIIKTSDKNTLVLLGIENQTKVDPKMLIRNMLYDAFSYQNQTINIERSKNNGKIKLKPVITLVIYYSDKEWTGPRDLYSMFDSFDESLKEYVPNYKLNIIEPYKMTEEDFKKLDYNLAGMFELIKNSNDKKAFSDLVYNKYNDLEPEIGELLNVVINAGLVINEREGKISMCKAIDDIRKDGEVIGEARGAANTLKENIKTMYKNGMSSEDIAKYLSLDLSFVKEVLGTKTN